MPSLGLNRRAVRSRPQIRVLHPNLRLLAINFSKRVFESEPSAAPARGRNPHQFPRSLRPQAIAARFILPTLLLFWIESFS
jgi:hypothetical protein